MALVQFGAIIGGFLRGVLMRSVLLRGACKNTAVDRAMTTRSMGDGNLKAKRGAPKLTTLPSPPSSSFWDRGEASFSLSWPGTPLYLSLSPFCEQWSSRRRKVFPGWASGPGYLEISHFTCSWTPLSAHRFLHLCHQTRVPLSPSMRQGASGSHGVLHWVTGRFLGWVGGSFGKA